MQTLGLASEQKASDGMLKRLFWPTIENAYDVDLVGVQGFWVCLVVGSLSLLMLVMAGSAGGPLTLLINLLVGLFLAATYFLAGLGVRERSVGAAFLIFLCYLVDRVLSFETTMGPFGLGFPLLGLVALMLLFANVRATVLSKKWRDVGTGTDDAEMPERSTATFTDEMANRLPTMVWPWGKFLFYPLAGLLLLLTTISAVATPMLQSKRAALMQQRRQQQIRAGQSGDR